jgi:hypothetical protein
LPIVAWSEVVVVTGRGTAAGSLALISGAVVAVDVLGRSGSAGRPGVAGWFVGFHIVIEILSFLTGSFEISAAFRLPNQIVLLTKRRTLWKSSFSY